MGEKASKGMNRRSFLKGGLAAGGAVVVAGRAGCAPQAGPMPSTGTGSDGLPDQWDYETDVVAIGAGAAGIAAGIEARDLGLDIIVLESQGKVGGNSAICNGGMCIPGSGLQKEQGIEDSPELMAQDLISYLGVDVYEDYIRLLAEQQGLLWDWLNDLGVEFRKESLVGTTGQSVPREHHVVPGVTITNLCDAAKERGAEFMLNTTAKHFVQDPASKMVIGVQAGDKSARAFCCALVVMRATSTCSINGSLAKGQKPTWRRAATPSVRTALVFSWPWRSAPTPVISTISTC